jgi:hypothetical protein
MNAPIYQNVIALVIAADSLNAATAMLLAASTIDQPKLSLK